MIEIPAGGWRTEAGAASGPYPPAPAGPDGAGGAIARRGVEWWAWADSSRRVLDTPVW